MYNEESLILKLEEIYLALGFSEGWTDYQFFFEFTLIAPQLTLN